MKRFLFSMICLLFLVELSAQQKEIHLKILETTDIHGNYFPYDFIEEKPGKGSLARVYTYLKGEREKYGNRLLMLDNGDILQGQPSAYYYNYIDTISKHLCPRILNYMGYNAGTLGNHDIETGPRVYNRLIRQSDFPWMAANAVFDEGKNTGSYFKPYSLFEIEGIRIAVLGIITPGIPTWLPKNLWPDMHFEDAQETVRYWVPILKNKEKADVIIGLFHLGMNGNILANGLNEGHGYNLAHEIPELDIVFIGHDHLPASRNIFNIQGRPVVIVNAGPYGNNVADVELTVRIENGKVIKKTATGKLVDMADYKPDAEFLTEFKPDFDAIKAFVSEKIGTITESLRSRDAYFGPSAFVDLIHRIQLDLTGADISFAAPLSYDTQIEKGDLYVSDMFKLYKYENFLYTMTLSGQEIKDFLESCYSIWINQMSGTADHLFLLRKNKSGKMQFAYPSYNFDSAAGISYAVDVTKPAGQRIIIGNILKNGKPFEPNQKYSVAVNSYRGNGGGEHLTKGAGIPMNELSSRIVNSTPVDLRYYMMQWIKKNGTVQPEIISDWKLVPERLVKPAAERDYLLLFGRK
ncbi:MAG: bifunctional metallophosphatase/5'-nucleotidase [Dysgonamonadaceae bacterium]|jgi:2',3'-cyclic-nucleotide 2'-phosphodiesterase/3'-nucleotidase|nr:bifunctional metallophosphatase/5'-nucleotidase [Dysgonamonadaceae bacterium]